MMKDLPSKMLELFKRLRDRKFPLSFEDWLELEKALKAGFGLSSRESLRNLCCMLWAKSRKDQEILISLFEKYFPLNEDWKLPIQKSSSQSISNESPEPEIKTENNDRKKGENGETKLNEDSDKTDKKNNNQNPQEDRFHIQPQKPLPFISLTDIKISKRPFVFVPQFPINSREIAQAGRRFRLPMRIGPPIEIDIEATVMRRSRTGVISPIVLRPKRRNLVRLLLLVDRQGSMNPFHAFIEEFCYSIKHSAKLNKVVTYYFHNVPVKGADPTALNSLKGQIFPTMDSVLSLIKP